MYSLSVDTVTEPTVEAVENAVDYMQSLYSQGTFNGLGESIQEAIDVVNEWQIRCEDSESDEDE